jgi:hypothetical protein
MIIIIKTKATGSYPFPCIYLSKVKSKNTLPEEVGNKLAASVFARMKNGGEIGNLYQIAYAFAILPNKYTSQDLPTNLHFSNKKGIYTRLCIKDFVAAKYRK